MKIKRKDYENQLERLRKLEAIARCRVVISGVINGESVVVSDMTMEILAGLAREDHETDTQSLAWLTGPIRIEYVRPEVHGYERFLMSKYNERDVCYTAQTNDAPFNIFSRVRLTDES